MLKFSHCHITVAKLIRPLVKLRADEAWRHRGNDGAYVPVLLAGLGVGSEISNWYMKVRAMQNAVDAAAMAAASNAADNYNASSSRGRALWLR